MAINVPPVGRRRGCEPVRASDGPTPPPPWASDSVRDHAGDRSGAVPGEWPRFPADDVHTCASLRG